MDIKKKGRERHRINKKKKVGGVTVTMATPVDSCISILGGVHARRSPWLYCTPGNQTSSVVPSLFQSDGWEVENKSGHVGGATPRLLNARNYFKYLPRAPASRRAEHDGPSRPANDLFLVPLSFFFLNGSFFFRKSFLPYLFSAF